MKPVMMVNDSMRKLLNRLLLGSICFGVLMAGLAFADGNVPSNTPGATAVAITSMQSATYITCANGTTQQTLTLTPAAGQSVYLVSLDSRAQATSAPAASAIITTSTNFGSMTRRCGLTATAGVSCSDNLFSASPIKAPATGAVTFISNAAITNVTYDLCATWFSAL